MALNRNAEFLKSQMVYSEEALKAVQNNLHNANGAQLLKSGGAKGPEAQRALNDLFKANEDLNASKLSINYNNKAIKETEAEIDRLETIVNE